MSATQRVVYPSSTNDRTFLDPLIPGLVEKWAKGQPPGNYTCLNITVEPRDNGWYWLILTILRDEI